MMIIRVHAKISEELLDHLPTRGLSEVMGMMADTVFRNMVSDNSMVTPGKLDFKKINLKNNGTLFGTLKLRKYLSS